MINVASNKNDLISVAFLIIKIPFLYVAYLPLTGVVIICVFFASFFLINFNGGDLSFLDISLLSPFYSWLGVYGDGNNQQADIKAIYTRLTLILMLFSLGFSLIWQKVTKHKVNLSLMLKALIGTLTITFFLVLAQASTFFESAADGAEGIRIMLLVFWFIAIILFGINFLIVGAFDLIGNEIEKNKQSQK